VEIRSAGVLARVGTAAAGTAPVSDSHDPLDPAALRRWASTIKGAVILPGDIAYEDGRRVWNLAVDRRPAAIVRCAGPDDILRTVELVGQYGLPLAIRSGGHSQAGHGVVEGGVVADLGSLRAIDVDPDQRRVRVASGARGRDVLAATEAHGLVTPMGGCPDVGVGGLTLGGGENFLMARFGAVCDNVVGAQVVTADGQLLTAHDGEHADLFWALRGGGGNFGVVVSFDYQLHDVGELLSGQFLFPVSRAAETMKRYRDLMDDPADELETSAGLTPDSSSFFLALTISGDRSEAERLAARWGDALRPADENLKWSTYSAGMVVPPAASTGSGVFLPEMSDDVIAVLAAAMTSAPPAATVVWNDFHGAVTRVARDATAFPLRRRGYDLFLNAPWTSAESQARAFGWIADVRRALRPFGSGVYVNNLTDDEADRIPEAYGENYARLAAIKRKYDPENVFRRNHNIAP
jgi:FAD/FMN-containing dehydrogenase